MAVSPGLKTALVTGASSGIGREISRLLARKGLDLILVARRESALSTLANELQEKHGIRVTIIAKDIALPGTPLELHAELLAKNLTVDILVNNAGLGYSADFLDDEISHDQQTIDLNITALTHLCKLFGKDMVERGRGGILNVASTAAFQPGPGMAVYYASKAYVLHFSEALANELKGTGVSLTVLCPGPTRTEFDAKAGMTSSKLFKSPLVQSAEEVAKAGVEGLFQGKTLVISSFLNWLLVFSGRFAPRQLTARITRSLNDKKVE